MRPSNSLLDLENNLLKELDVVLGQEQELWSLKSRINWMIQGDRNTAFFHVSTLIRRKRNQILAIKNGVGDWLYAEGEIMDFIRKGFIDTFTTSSISSDRVQSGHSQWQARLSDEEKESLGSLVTEDEIKASLWSLKAFKAPGPDGLHAGFFQHFWPSVGHSVVEAVKKIFRDREMPAKLNQTHIVLIPKIQGPETLGNFRPISLCNTTYKIVTKIIVARIRPYLENLISPLQSAFVPGRKGIDNAIIVQELVHTISKKKGNVGYMAIKIDYEKAYDKLEWSFIRRMLIRINLPTNLVELIMSCVSSVTTSILFNGSPLDPISPSRGIRQGDPLSPYIFILCVDYLSQLIEEKCNEKMWSPVKASSGPAFSHLMFADDLILFAKADLLNCSSIRDILDEFCAVLGQPSVNLSLGFIFHQMWIKTLENR